LHYEDNSHKIGTNILLWSNMSVEEKFICAAKHWTSSCRTECYGPN